MKNLLTVTLFFYCLACPAIDPLMNDVRVLYQQAATQEDSCKELIALLEPFDEKNNPLLLGYKGSATMMMAQHVLNPFSKLTYFKKGKDMLHLAIESDQSNVELRYLRFTAQTNAPSFLRYGNKIEEDKTFLVESVSLLDDQSLKSMILGYLKTSAFLSDTEKKALEIRS